MICKGTGISWYVHLVLQVWDPRLYHMGYSLIRAVAVELTFELGVPDTKKKPKSGETCPAGRQRSEAQHLWLIVCGTPQAQKRVHRQKPWQSLVLQSTKLYAQRM